MTSWQPVDAKTQWPWRPTARQLPLGIHGTPKSGASFFTIALTADLVRRGRPVVFLCAHGDGVLALQRELGLQKSSVKFDDVTAQAAVDLSAHQLVTLYSSQPGILLSRLRGLRDWSERLIVIKNIETVLSPALYTIVRPHRQLILSGDFNGQLIRSQPQDYASTIAFSEWPKDWGRHRDTLPSYVGILTTGSNNRQLILKEVTSPAGD